MRHALRLQLLLLPLLLVAGEGSLDLNQARMVLRVNDSRWVERVATRLAAALGSDPLPMRRTIATLLFRSKGLDGIDLARPAVLAWREGASPFIAIIPVANRRKFLDDFGLMPEGEPPLVRIGDRDGTTVFSQNHPEGLREYRLLVTNDTAYLARTVDECRQLAARPPLQVSDGNVPLAMTVRGGRIPEMGDIPFALPPTGPLGQPLDAGALAAAWRDLLGQVDALAWELRPNLASNEVRLLLKAQARSDSPLAAWIAAQRNQSGRLAAALRSERSAVVMQAHAAWQGQLQRLGELLLPLARVKAGGAWTPEIEEAWKQVYAGWERTSDLAWVLDVAGPERAVAVTAVELARADEQQAALRQVAGVMAGGPVQDTTVAGQPAGLVRSAAAGRPAEFAFAAVDRISLGVETSPGEAALPRLEAAMGRVAKPATPEGEPCIAGLWIDLDRLLRFSPRFDQDLKPVPTVLSAWFKAGAVDQVQIEVQANLQAVAGALGRLGDVPATRMTGPRR